MKSELILLHGALGNESQFTSLKERLNSKFSLHSFNFSYHEKGDFVENFSINKFTEDLQSYCKMHNIQNCSIFGYSMGGYVALKLATMETVNINKIVTLGTKFNWSADSVQAELKMLDPEIVLTKVPQFADVLENRFGKYWPELMKSTGKMMLRLSTGDAILDESFQQIKLPVLILRGEADKMVTANESMQVATLIPHATYTEILNGKHPIESINDKELSDIITAFVSKQKH